MNSGAAAEASDSAIPEPSRPRRSRSAGVVVAAEPDVLRKAVNTLAIVPKSARITTLGRKSYNVLLFHAQDQGLDKELFRAPLETIIKGLDFDSHDHALVKKHLRAMVSTTVEWQSPTTGEGSSWNVSGLLAHARLSKERGQVWIEWSYAVNLKQELLQPTVFARLRLEILSQLRSHAGVALYEICTRYREVGRTARQAWRWWQPVLSGNPPSEKTARLEYRIFKRDTLKPAIAEINAITDIEIELVEHKQGRFIDEIQFRIQPRKQAAPVQVLPPQAIDMTLAAQAQALGVSDEAAEALMHQHGEAALRAGLDALQRRAGTGFPDPLRHPLRYLRSLMPPRPKASEHDLQAPAMAAGTRSPSPGGARARAPGPKPLATEAPRKANLIEDDGPVARERRARRQAQWLAEWMRRRRQQCIDEIAALPVERQTVLVDELLVELERRKVHPTLRKRLQTGGWQHPMVLHEMVRFYARVRHGEKWDQPSPAQLLEVAAEMDPGSA